MKTYLDVGIPRVQQWLARSPDLAGRRGASGMLVEATGKKDWEKEGWLQELQGVSWCEEAGDISGVVSLVLDGTDPSAAIAKQVIMRLRQKLPYATISATWGSANSYAEFRELKQSRSNTLVLPPAPAEVPLAGRCGKCLQSPAVPGEAIPQEQNAILCADCRLRYLNDNTARNFGGSKRNKVWPMPTLVSEVQRLIAKFDIPHEMDDLAKLTPQKGAQAQTRLATLYADGNAVGAFIRGLINLANETSKTNSDQEHSPQPNRPTLRKDRIAAVIDTATNRAIARALVDHTVFVREDRPSIAAVPHVVGGDDVVVSVPAAYAWSVVDSFVRYFDEEFASLCRDEGTGFGRKIFDRLDELPTMSVGLVFHHCKEPISAVIEQAFELLVTQAKRAGAQSHLAWSDVMVADPAMTLAGPRPATWLTDHLTRRSPMVAGLPPAHRSLLLAELQTARDEASTPAQQQELRKAALARVEKSARASGSFEILQELYHGTKSKDDEGERYDRLRWALQIAKDHTPAESKADSTKDVKDVKEHAENPVAGTVHDPVEDPVKGPVQGPAKGGVAQPTQTEGVAG